MTRGRAKGGQSPSLREIIRGVQRQMWIDFRSRTAQLPTPGEKGLAREDVVRDFLRHYLPGRFHVESGFVVDAGGGVSRQMDVVIYDHLSAPRFQITEGTRILPVEAVAGVISVKSFLDKGALVEAMTNIRSVTGLDRTASGKPYITFGGVPALSQYDLTGIEPVFGAVFAFDGYPLDKLALAIDEGNQGLLPHQRVQLVCVLNRGVVSYLEGAVFEPTYAPSARVAIVEDPELSLPLFYSFVANGVWRKIPIGISFRRYLELDLVPVRWVG